MARSEAQDDVFAFMSALAPDDPSNPGVTRIDTHANVIFLVGDKAFKIKRAVTFPFLDYSTLELREKACKAEITFNRPNAPQLYLDALPITRQIDGSLALDGAGEPVEWVVRMNRFDRDAELDSLAEKAPFTDTLCDQLATMMAAAHDVAPVRSGEGFHCELAAYVEQNDAAFQSFPELFPPDDVHHLTRQARSMLAFIKALIVKRGEQGLVRRCHGDAHLRNIVLVEGRPVLFDAVEFSDAIATGDVLYDLAFLLMDLWERGQPRAANRVFNRYLDLSPLESHPEGLAALPFYLMMRSAIRSKIAASAAMNQSDPKEQQALQEQARTYFQNALRFLEPHEPCLMAIGGLSGTGKTTLAYELAPEFGRAPGARVLRTDVLRKRLLNLPENEPAPEDAYSKENSDKVYDALDETIQCVLAAGHSAVFDAVFASEPERVRVQDIANRVEATFIGLWLEAPEKIMKNRVANRRGDASDATTAVVDAQLDYDIGSLTWTRVDAGESILATAAQAREAMRYSISRKG